MSEKITKEYSLVIEHTNTAINEPINYNKLITNLKIISEFYAIILHDKDTKIDPETNKEIEKRPHYHLIIKLKKRMRKMTLLNHLAQFNNLPPEMIQVQYLENMELMIRYLIHLDNQEKHQYAPFQIKTNAPYTVQEILNNDINPNEINAKLLIYYIYKMRYSLTTILEKIGIKNFNKYAKTITAIKQEAWESVHLYEWDKDKKE